MLKVIVTGAYSTGKTSFVNTLAEALGQDGLTVARLPDVARTCVLPLNEAQTDTASLWLLTTQVSREIEAGLGSEDILLCDRGIPDILAHHRDNCFNRSGSWLADMNAFPERWISTYDLILFSRVDESIPIAADGLRSENPAYRSRLDGHAAAILTGRANVLTLAHDLQERVCQSREAVALSLTRSRNSVRR